jgi:hypothetical protein
MLLRYAARPLGKTGFMPGTYSDSSGVHGFEIEVNAASYENVFAG